MNGEKFDLDRDISKIEQSNIVLNECDMSLEHEMGKWVVKLILPKELSFDMIEVSSKSINLTKLFQ